CDLPGGSTLVKDGRLGPYLSDFDLAMLSTTLPNWRRRNFPQRKQPWEPSYGAAEHALRALREENVPLLAGTDAPNPGSPIRTGGQSTKRGGSPCGKNFLNLPPPPRLTVICATTSPSSPTVVN